MTIKRKEIDFKQLKIDYLIDRMKLVDICEKWDISKTYFYTLIKKNGIKKRGKLGQKNIKIINN